MGKYNNGQPISINDIPADEKRAALKEFAEGLPLLEECLITVNDLGFETNSCCRGFHKITNKDKFIMDYLFNHNLDMLALSRCMCAPYISFAKDATKLYSKLSSELINDPNFQLHHDHVEFYGPKAYELMANFLKDIKGEQKDNLADLSMKMDQPLSPDTYYNSFVYGFTQSGFEEKDIEVFKIMMLLTAFSWAKLSSYGDIHAFCQRNQIDESMEEVILKEMKVTKGDIK